MMHVVRRLTQALALLVILTGGAQQLHAELECPSTWGVCVQECVDPAGVCENSHPGCEYEAYCSGAPCFDEEEDHVLCINEPN